MAVKIMTLPRLAKTKSIEPAVFIDNRPQTVWTRLFGKPRKGMVAMPLLTYQRSYWYDQRWEIMCSSKDGRVPAVPTLCGWCGGTTPAYPLCLAGCCGTSCHECGRTVDEFYRDWVYRAEYSDGCKVVLFQNGYSSSEGADSRSGYKGNHAPHSAFSNPDEIPTYEFLSPLFFVGGGQFGKEELCKFFRSVVYRESGWPPGSPISTLAMQLPKDRNVPYRLEHHGHENF